jgi:hypothetical protein
MAHICLPPSILQQIPFSALVVVSAAGQAQSCLTLDLNIKQHVFPQSHRMQYSGSENTTAGIRNGLKKIHG